MRFCRRHGHSREHTALRDRLLREIEPRLAQQGYLATRDVARTLSSYDPSLTPRQVQAISHEACRRLASTVPLRLVWTRWPDDPDAAWTAGPDDEPQFDLRPDGPTGSPVQLLVPHDSAYAGLAGTEPRPLLAHFLEEIDETIEGEGMVLVGHFFWILRGLGRDLSPAQMQELSEQAYLRVRERYRTWLVWTGWPPNLDRARPADDTTPLGFDLDPDEPLGTPMLYLVVDD